MSQGLSFQNLTKQTVWVILLYYDPGCGAANQNFRKQGWWKLNPGQTVVVWNADLRTINRYIYFEAEFDADAPVWTSTGNAWIEITDAAFNQCAMDETGCDRWADCIELDVGGTVAVNVQLGPAAGQFLAFSSYPPGPGG